MFFNLPVVIREKYGTKHITYLFTNVCIIHIYKDLYMYIHTHVFSNLSGVGDWVIVAPIVDDIFGVKMVLNWDLIGSSPSSGVSLCR